jgi:hypothetical protein
MSSATIAVVPEPGLPVINTVRRPEVIRRA